MSDREHRIPPTSGSVHKPRVGKISHGPWPRFYKVDQQFHYDGPPPASCSCSTPHAPMKGTDGQDMFNSSISAGFSEQFWFSCTASFLSIPLFLRLTFSFSGWSGSAFSLYDVWARGSLSRSFLVDYAGVSSAVEFFGPWRYGDDSRFCNVTYFGTVSDDTQPLGTDLDMAR